MALPNTLEIQGMTAGAVFDTLVKGGLTTSESAILVSGWIFEHFGRTRRRFNYQEDFPEVDANCVSAFARTFLHLDWTDGQNVVQAEQTLGEEGFNSRFHRIEADLDALGADVATAFTCMADMRRSLNTLLEEIKVEVNRVNSDIHECCNTDDGPRVVAPATFGGLVEGGAFLGTSKFGGKDVSVWRTDRGVMMLPSVHTIGVDLMADVRVNGAGELARFTTENRAARVFFRNRTVTVREFRDKFGSEESTGGRNLDELLRILPDDATFRSAANMVNAVAEREAAAIRTTSGASAAVASALGLERESESAANAPVERMEAIPSRVRTVLMRRGVATVEDLANASSRSLVRMMRVEGVSVSAGDISEWRATANTLRLIL